MASAPVERIAAALRTERTRAGMSLSEVAKRAGIAKSTLSQLESGSGNPSVETVWALAVALDVPFARLVDPPRARPTLIRAGEGPAVESGHAHYRVALLASCPPSARRDVYRITVEPGDAKNSEPHPPGTVEHVILATGRALAGPLDDPVELRAGDYLGYPADVAHTMRALHRGTTAVMLVEHA